MPLGAEADFGGGGIGGGTPQISSVVPPGNGGTPPPFLSERTMYCPLHPEDPLQFFCLQCQTECICAECAVHGAHRGHDVLNVRHAYKNMAGRITEAMSKAQARVEEHQQATQLANSQRQEVDVVITKGKRAIQDAFEKMRTSLGQKEAQLLLAADQCERSASEALQAKSLRAEGHVRTLQEAQISLKKLDTRGEEVKVLNAYANIRSKVLDVLEPMDGLDCSIEHELEELKSQVQSVLDAQVAEVSALNARVADIRRADASAR